MPSAEARELWKGFIHSVCEVCDVKLKNRTLSRRAGFYFFSMCTSPQTIRKKNPSSVCLLPAVCAIFAQPAPGADPHAEGGCGTGKGEAQSAPSEHLRRRQQPLHQPGGRYARVSESCQCSGLFQNGPG